MQYLALFTPIVAENRLPLFNESLDFCILLTRLYVVSQAQGLTIIKVNQKYDSPVNTNGRWSRNSEFRLILIDCYIFMDWFQQKVSLSEWLANFHPMIMK